MTTFLESNKKLDYTFIHYLRIFACLLIVIKHVAGSAVDYFYNSATVAESIRVALLTINNILWFAVNLFFMITGFIYLSDDKECTYKSVSKNIIRLFLYLLVFGLIFTLLLEVIGGRRLFSLNDFFNLLGTRPITLDLVLKSLKEVLAGRNQWGHMWFMYEIIKIYLILPILKPFVKANEKNIFILLGITILFNYIFPMIRKPFGITIYNFFPAGIYIIMTVLGGAFAKIHKNIKTSYSCIAAFLAIVLIATYSYSNIITGSIRYIGTTNLISVIIATLTFTAFINLSKELRIVQLISKCTLLIYLLHPMVIHIFYGILKLNPLKYNLILSIPLTTLCIFISTLIIAFIIEFALGKLHLVFAIKNQVE